MHPSLIAIFSVVFVMIRSPQVASYGTCRSASSQGIMSVITLSHAAGRLRGTRSEHGAARPRLSPPRHRPLIIPITSRLLAVSAGPGRGTTLLRHLFHFLTLAAQADAGRRRPAPKSLAANGLIDRPAARRGGTGRALGQHGGNSQGAAATRGQRGVPRRRAASCLVPGTHSGKGKKIDDLSS